MSKTDFYKIMRQIKPLAQKQGIDFEGLADAFGVPAKKLQEVLITGNKYKRPMRLPGVLRGMDYLNIDVVRQAEILGIPYQNETGNTNNLDPADLVKMALDSAGFTMKSLAEEMGVKYNSLYQMINIHGLNKSNIHEVIKLLDYIQVDYITLRHVLGMEVSQDSIIKISMSGIVEELITDEVVNALSARYVVLSLKLDIDERPFCRDYAEMSMIELVRKTYFDSNEMDEVQIQELKELLQEPVKAVFEKYKAIIAEKAINKINTMGEEELYYKTPTMSILIEA